MNGLILFDYAHLKKEYVDVLTESIFRPCLRDIAIAKKEEQVIVQDKKQTKSKRRFGFGRRKLFRQTTDDPIEEIQLVGFHSLLRMGNCPTKPGRIQGNQHTEGESILHLALRTLESRI